MGQRCWGSRGALGPTLPPGSAVLEVGSKGCTALPALCAALKGTGNKVDDTEAFRREMLKANFQVTRGKFRFGPNQHPVQDWYAIRPERGADGKLFLKTQGRVLADRGDAYAEQCKL